MKLMSAEQLPLGFNPQPALTADDFIPTPANEAALAWLNRWPDWPSYGLVLVGPRGSGKTHLAHIWAHKADARLATSLDLVLPPRLVIEDACRWPEEAATEEKFFHLLNHIAGNKGALLITATTPPAQWKIKLPDLRSRLLALPLVTIDGPDDTALVALMGKLFADRQLHVSPDVLDYLVRRIERSYAAAAGVVAALDAAALATGRAVTLPLAREVLARIEEMPE